MRETVRPALTLLAVLTVLTGVVYPALVTVVAQVAFPSQANGSLIVAEDGQAVGSTLIGQPFRQPGHFWGRLSATSPLPYNAAASSGSNLGPTNPDLARNTQSRLDALKQADPGSTGAVAAVPVDLVTSSGSGLDPHISPASAARQIPRVAAARGLGEDQVRALVEKHTEDRQFGVLGEPRVHVLELNRELDRLEPGSKRGPGTP